MGEWCKDAMPMDGTPICVRAVSTYRYQPYKPTSEQRKRGIKGRWQEMSEYGGWQNCEAPAGDGWMLASEWTPDAAEAPDPAATMKEVVEVLTALDAVVAATGAYLPPDGIDKDECINRILQATDNPRINAAREALKALQHFAPHIHVAGTTIGRDIDECALCGRDIREDIHNG